MASRASVLTIACGYLGEPAPSGPDDTKPHVIRLNARLDGVAKWLLEQHAWNFASELTLLADDNGELGGWAHSYRKPAGCLRINSLSVDGRPRPEDGPVRYRDRAGRILVDLDSCYLDFVSAAHIQNYGAWPEVFAEAAGCRTAYTVSAVLNNGRGEKIDGLTEATRLQSIAELWDAAQIPAEPKPLGRLVRGRFSGVRSRENG